MYLATSKNNLRAREYPFVCRPLEGKPDQHVSDFNIFAGNDFAFFHHANNEAGQIVLAFRIKARHLRRFTADQRTAVVPACIGHAFNNLFRNLRIERAGSKVIHKKQWRRALHGNVIHAVVYQIAAHGVMQVHHERHFELGADAIHAGNQHGIAKLFLVDGKHAAEAADLAHYSRRERAMGEVFNALLGAVGAVNINAAIGIGDGSLFQMRKVRLYLCIAGTRGDGVLYFSIASSEIPNPAQR